MIKLLLDVDTGIDDALALFFLAHAQKQGQLEILGSTTVGGNAEVAQTTLNTLKIWEMLELEIPVTSGAERPLLGPFWRQRHLYTATTDWATLSSQCHGSQHLKNQLWI